ncbi:hypothetical protein HMPREF0653_01470 [Prevotella disiens JCM 6334 = ATCC 29426]|uniref:Uncharacterized protein n=1 Tax=Prevotella disiens JCM 6334 = ATCC 29426 TaxID=1235811 RepID=A0ABN0NRZ2_9BACT|nr:hypothetical protein HMPREF0653_01470 [Prevotella disiens JCM 6334 = ATCC 29426]
MIGHCAETLDEQAKKMLAATKLNFKLFIFLLFLIIGRVGLAKQVGLVRQREL